MSVSSINQTSPYHTVFSSPALRVEFRKFLDNIFLQLDADAFFVLIDDILSYATSDEQVYSELHRRIGEAKPSTLKTTCNILESLRGQKAALIGQMIQQLGKGHPVDGLVEIGFPGRFVRPMQKAFAIQGRITAVHPQEGLSDVVQSGFPRSYDQFIPLNDYEPLDRGKLKSQSVDAVTCFIGLHHIPPEKLQDYIRSIHRVLRPGGSFILRDHDATGDRMHALVSTVHSVFNAATGVTPQEEKEEVRNFLPLAEWYQILEENGFQRASEPLLRSGDPSDNSLVRFVKVETPAEKQLAEIKASLEKEKGYHRDLMQTYLTAPEWRNVEMAQEYAAFLKEGKPFYQFPYFKQIQTFWQVFADSYKAARQQHGFVEVVTSEYMMMNLFIGISSTLEFLSKGLISLPFSWIKGESQTIVQQRMGEMMEEYAQFIEHTPFYNFSYFKQIKPLWEAFMHSQTERTFTDFLTVFTGTLELIARGIISAPVGWVYNAPENQESETIQLLVRDVEDDIEEVDERIKVKKAFGDSGYKLLEIPRYRPFGDIVEKLSASDEISMVKIAGQELIQVKVALESHLKDQILKDLKGCRVLYDYPNGLDPKRKYVELEVDVEVLSKVIPALKARGADIAYVHDF